MFMEDWFGLQTLYNRGDVHAYIFPGVKHTKWHGNENVFRKAMLPWLNWPFGNVEKIWLFSVFDFINGWLIFFFVHLKREVSFTSFFHNTQYRKCERNFVLLNLEFWSCIYLSKGVSKLSKFKVNPFPSRSWTKIES